MQSREHAEFIIYFAGIHGIANEDLWYEGSFFCFIEDVKGDLILSFYEEDVASSINYKKITIPLPPKESGDDAVLSSDEETELKSRAMASELNSQSNDDEWPKVGDEVVFNFCKFKVVAKYNQMLMLATLDDCGFALAGIKDCEKPKTPEDILSEELAKKGVQDVYILACQIINGEFDSIKYAPKGVR